MTQLPARTDSIAEAPQEQSLGITRLHMLAWSYQSSRSCDQALVCADPCSCHAKPGVLAQVPERTGDTHWDWSIVMRFCIHRLCDTHTCFAADGHTHH